MNEQRPQSEDVHYKAERTGDYPEGIDERRFQDCVDLVAGADHVSKEMKKYILRTLEDERKWRALPPLPDEKRVPALWGRDAKSLTLLQADQYAYIFDRERNDNWEFRIPTKREIEQGKNTYTTGYNPETAGDFRAHETLKQYETKLSKTSAT